MDSRERAVRVLVIGGGVIGVLSAFFLSRAGHGVTLVEQAEGPGLGTSFANGGQIGASEVAPWAGPGVPWKVLRWLGRADAPFRLRLQPDPDQWRWLLAFLRRCRGQARLERMLMNLPLALLSRREMTALVKRADSPDFCLMRKGILRLFDQERALQGEWEHARHMLDQGLVLHLLTPEACVETEPALTSIHQRGGLAGGIFSPDDMSGDAFLFTRHLARQAGEAGVTLAYGQKVVRLHCRGSRVVSVQTDQAEHQADAVVIAAGVQAAKLVQDTGFRLPVYPVKGYSVSLPVTQGEGFPHVSLTDERRRIVITRLGGQLRAAGQAEFAGFDASVEPRQARAVLAAVQDLLPAVGDGVRPACWAGLRPMTPDGSPVIGRLGDMENIFLNTGHGTLGWTLGAGSARLLCELITGAETSIPSEPYAFSRFQDFSGR